MKKTKRVVAMLLMLAMMLGMTACGGSEEDSSGGGDTGDGGEKAYTDYGVLIGPADGKTKDDYVFSGVFGGLNPYCDPMEGAAAKAAEELGIDTPDFYVPQQWDQNEQNELLDACISRGSTGIYLMTSNGTAGNEQITKMVDSGVNVVTVGGEPDTPTKSTLTLSTDVYYQGYEGTKRVIEGIKKSGRDSGKIVNLTGDLSDPNTELRMQGCEDACKENEGFEVFQTLSGIDSSEGSMEAVENLLASSGHEIDGIICTAYYPAIACAKLITEDYSNIIAVGCDADDSVKEAVKEGRMYGTMRQNPWGQAYLAIVTLKMLEDGWVFNNGEYKWVDSTLPFLDASNIEEEEQACIDTTMELLETWTDNFTAPEGYNE